jgi:crotonobetainyl-CoA:carnitine CoA-transferase CaiB-like acyl-CoA transferase
MGKPAWAQDPKFQSRENRLINHDELDKYISQWTDNFKSHDLMNLLQQHLIPAGVVQTGEQLYNDPHLRERGFIVSVDHSEWGSVEHPGIAIKFSDTPGRITRGVPYLGEHNEEIFSNLLGVSENDMGQLLQKEVIS